MGIAIGWGIYQVGEAAGKTFTTLLIHSFDKYEQENILDYTTVITIVVTAVGLGLSAYNYYVFDRPFSTVLLKACCLHLL